MKQPSIQLSVSKTRKHLRRGTKLGKFAIRLGTRLDCIRCGFLRLCRSQLRSPRFMKSSAFRLTLHPQSCALPTSCGYSSYPPPVGRKPQSEPSIFWLIQSSELTTTSFLEIHLRLPFSPTGLGALIVKGEPSTDGCSFLQMKSCPDLKCRHFQLPLRQCHFYADGARERAGEWELLVTETALPSRLPAACQASATP